jgi:hypothetical protein
MVPVRVRRRVVEHPDGVQRLAPSAPGGAEFTHQANEVGLGDAEFDVLPVRLFAPMHDGFGVVGEPVAAFVGGPHTHLVEPAGQVGGRADVGTDGDNGLAQLSRGALGAEPLPWTGGVHAQLGGQCLVLGNGQQRSVDLRVALDRQPAALDGVGDDDGWSGVIDLFERRAQLHQIVATQIAQGAQQAVVVEFADQACDARGVGSLAGESPA